MPKRWHCLIFIGSGAVVASSRRAGFGLLGIALAQPWRSE
jgi:hypothetical protein